MTPDNIHFVSYLSSNYNTIRVRVAINRGYSAPAIPDSNVPPAAPSMNQKAPWQSARYDSQPSEKLYSYKVPLNQHFEVGDLVVVEMAGVIKVVEVAVVDSEPTLDFQIANEYKWIIQKLDTTDYEARLQNEKQFLQQMTKLEQSRRQRELKEQFIQQYRMDGETAKDFDEALKILNNGN